MALTLADINEALDDKYGPAFEIDLGDGCIISLVAPVRMGREQRKVLSEISDRYSKEDDDEEKDSTEAENQIDELLRAIIGDREKANKFFAAFGDDLAAKMFVYESYSKAVGLGEASSSQE